MENVLVRERYKIVRVLEAADGYAFAEAVDIADRETSVRLLNIYEGEWLPVYARIFADMNVCPAFCEAFLSGDSLTAVFQPSRGVAIDRVFYRGADWSWKDRLVFAGQLLHRALELADLPPEVGCAALLSDNVRVETAEKQVSLRFRLRPMTDMNARELALLASDQVKKILAPRFQQGDAEYEFCCRLERGEFTSIVPLYACWRRAEQEMTEEYEKLDRKNAFKRWFTYLWMQGKRWVKRRKRR